MFYVAVCWIHHIAALGFQASKTDVAIKKTPGFVRGSFATIREDNFAHGAEAAPPSLRRREVVLYFAYGGTQDARVKGCGLRVTMSLNTNYCFRLTTQLNRHVETFGTVASESKKALEKQCRGQKTAHLNYCDCQIGEFSHKHQSEIELEYGLERNEKEAKSETCEKRDGKHNSC